MIAPLVKAVLKGRKTHPMTNLRDTMIMVCLPAIIRIREMNMIVPAPVVSSG
jgi:hypothetical protein